MALKNELFQSLENGKSVFKLNDTKAIIKLDNSDIVGKNAIQILFRDIESFLENYINNDSFDCRIKSKTETDGSCYLELSIFSMENDEVFLTDTEYFYICDYEKEFTVYDVADYEQTKIVFSVTAEDYAFLIKNGFIIDYETCENKTEVCLNRNTAYSTIFLTKKGMSKLGEHGLNTFSLY